MTGKYTCSISEINGPVKTVKLGHMTKSKRILTGPSISIKEENLLNQKQEAPTASLHSERQLESFGSKGLSSENSKNLSEMSLILTPMQVKLKRDKFTKSAKKLASMKSRFGSVKQTEQILNRSNQEKEERNVENKTGFERMLSRLSRESGKRKESANLTQKTDLSGSNESFTKMFKELKISLGSDEEENRGKMTRSPGQMPRMEIYSQKSDLESQSEKKCFLDEAFDADANRGPFPSFLNGAKWHSKNQGNSSHLANKWAKGNEWSQNTQKSRSKEEMWRSAESAEFNEMSGDLKGGFDLMRIIDNPGLYSKTRRSHAFRDHLGLQSSNAMVRKKKEELIRRR